MLFIILHLGIYLRHCGKCLIFFTQMQRLERFLRQVHLLPIEALKTLRVFWLSQSIHLKEQWDLQNVVPKDVRFAFMFQKQTFLNPFRQNIIVRLIITSIVMINI